MGLHSNKHNPFWRFQFVLWLLVFFVFAVPAMAEEKANDGTGMFSGRIIVDGVTVEKGNGSISLTDSNGNPLSIGEGPYNISLFGGLKKQTIPRERATTGVTYNSSTGHIFVLFLPEHTGETVKFATVKQKVGGVWRKLKVTKVGGVPGNTFVVPTTPYGFSDFHKADVEATLPAVPNKPPVVNAGAKKTVDELKKVALNDATASDPDNSGTLTYKWRIVSGGGSLENGTALKAIYKAPRVDVVSEATLELAVSDGEDTTKDLLKVIINNVPNKTPTAVAGVDQTVDENKNVNLTGASSSDPDNDPLTYKWTQKSGTTVVLKGENTATPSFTAPEVAPAGETLIFELTVDDGKDGGIAKDTVKINVSNINKPPVANAGSDAIKLISSLVGLDGSLSSDPDGDTISYAWTQVSGATVVLTGATTATPTFTAPATASVLEFELTVSDGTLSHSDNVIINVTVKAPPVADAGADQEVTENSTPVLLDGRGSSDSDGTIVTYAWKQLKGVDVELVDANSAIAYFTAPNLVEVNGKAQLIDNLVFELTVVDNDGLKSTDTVSIKITDDPNCFIATAAFGTPMASQIQILRDFRDSYLMTNALGREFVGFYYRVSPPVATYIAEREGLRMVIRWLLLPIIYAVEYPLVFLFAFVLFIAWRKRNIIYKRGYKFS
jgi:hypothetical protein